MGEGGGEAGGDELFCMSDHNCTWGGHIARVLHVDVHVLPGLPERGEEGGWGGLVSLMQLTSQSPQPNTTCQPSVIIIKMCCLQTTKMAATETDFALKFKKKLHFDFAE